MIKQRRSLGESLVEEGILTEDQLRKAQEEEKQSGQRLRKVLVRMGFVDEGDLVSFLSSKLGVPRIELANTLIDPKTIELVPESLARKYELIPVLKIGDRLTCAMVDPWNVFALDELRIKTQFTVEPAVATEGEIRRALDEHYGAQGTIEELIRSIDEKKPGLKEDRELGAKELEGIVQEPVVIKLVNLLIVKAVQEGASDIHIEPEEETLRTRVRIDGMLREVPSPPKHLHSAIVSRIKILANLDIAERRTPQDGRFNLKMEGKQIDIRVSCYPTIYGENVVLRLLNVSGALLRLSELGFSERVLSAYNELVKKPWGMILVTGPTGSGKTTTLYASLDKINSAEKNILTIEDPVEYRLSGIRQSQVHPKAQLTFASGLRSILRQDPDVIMVGEIRDRETAEIAIQAALTGHLVLSTLHTNDAAGAATRLVEMDVEPFLVSSSVVGILAQRLVRRICEGCKEKGTGKQGGGREEFYGKGCPRCMNTGYKGRIGIFELLVLDEKIRELIVSKSSAEEIRRYARSHGMTPIREDGLRRVLEGLTTLEEVVRVTQEE